MTAHAFSGGCHCGAVRYEVTTDLSGAISCNCSRCQKLGLILTFAPATSFRLTAGTDAMTDYRFNRNAIAHLFCSTCGVESFAKGVAPDGTETVAVNLRCLDGVEPDELSPRPIDGRSF